MELEGDFHHGKLWRRSKLNYTLVTPIKKKKEAPKDRMITGHFYRNNLSGHVVRCFGETSEGNFVVTRLSQYNTGAGRNEVIYGISPESVKHYIHEGRGLEDEGEDEVEETSVPARPDGFTGCMMYGGNKCTQRPCDCDG